MAGHTARVWPDIPHEYGRTYRTSMAGHLVLRYVPTLDSMLRLSHNTLIFDGSLIGIEFAEICVIVPELISVRKIPLRLKKEKYPLFFKHITNNPYFCAGKNSYEHKKAEKNTGQIIKTFFLSCNFFARIYQ
jgi:hypothetical protein